MSQIYYSDSSVLVKRHIHEIGTDWLLELLDPAANNSIITSTLTIVEGLSALNRRVREAALDATDYPQIAEDFLVISNNEYRFVDVTAEVIDNTQRLLETYPLRAGDDAAIAEGFTTDNPLLHP